MSEKQDLLRPAAGCDSIFTLSTRQKHYARPFEGQLCPIISTKRAPSRMQLLANGGSVYWIINSRIQARQLILGHEMVDDPAGGTRCHIYLDPALYRTQSYPQRAFQGWRYLDPTRIPPDIGLYEEGTEEDIPPEMEADLRELGLF
ncbi:MAG: DUF1489 family protein [Pseudobdellovibrionaceae bacterium]